MMRQQGILFALALFLVLPTIVVTQSGTDVNNLLTQLFTTDGYNKKVRPLTDQSVPVIIAMDFYLSAIIEFDEQDESLTTSGYLSLFWVDEYLDWTPANHSTIETLFLPQDDIWKPDISLRNTFKKFTGLGSSYLNLNVNYEGNVAWNPFQVLTSTCSVDITYFPFDSQICELKFTAWSYTKNEVELNLGNHGVILDEYSPNNAWELVNTSSREVNTEEAAVIFSMELKRKPLFYLLNIIVPVILLTFLNIATFLIPITTGEKASYGITVFLSLAVFLTIVASELPKNSDNTSLLGVYLMLMTTLSTVIVTICLIESRLSVREVSKQPINVIYIFFYEASQFIRCKTCKSKVIPMQQSPTKRLNELDIHDDTTMKAVWANEKNDNNNNDNNDNNAVEWMDIINAIDFVSFWFCLIFTFICTTVLGSVAVSKFN